MKDKNDFFKLLLTINDLFRNNNKNIPDEILKDAFEKYYKEFKENCDAINNASYEKNKINYDHIIEQLTELKETLRTSDIQSSKIKEAIDTYNNLLAQGVANVYKCGSDEYKKECDEQIREKIKKANKIRMMSHIGYSFLSYYKRELIYALTNIKDCSVQVIIMSDKLAGENQEILYQLCKNTKSQEIRGLKDAKIIYEEIKMEIGKNPSITGNICLKEYDFAPTGNILIVDNFVRFIPYLPGRQAETSVAIFGEKNENIKDGDGIFDEFETVFNNIWESPIKIDTQNPN